MQNTESHRFSSKRPGTKSTGIFENGIIPIDVESENYKFGYFCLFLTVPWVGLQYVVVAFPGHTYILLHAISCENDFMH